MSPELIGILAVGVALAGLILTAVGMSAATLRTLRSDMGRLRGEMKQLRGEMRGKMKQLRDEIRDEMKQLRDEMRDEMRKLASRVETLELRVGALEPRMARLEGLLEGAGLYRPAVVSEVAAD